MRCRAEWASDFFAAACRTDWETQESVPLGVMSPESRWLPCGLPFPGVYLFFLLSVLEVSSLEYLEELDYCLSMDFRDRVSDVDLLGPGSLFDMVEYR